MNLPFKATPSLAADVPASVRASAGEFAPVGAPTGFELSENEIQRSVFKHIKTRGVPGVFAFHPKNGGVHQRGRRAGINTGLGVIAGVPDVVIFWNGRAYAMELKTRKGKVSEDQKTVMAAITRAGIHTFVAFGLEAAIAWLEERGILRGKMR